MISIRQEIARVAAGEYDRQDNPLVNAPHTASMLLAADWKHPYEREEAAYPVASYLLGADRRGKYWTPVRRIDSAYGDRNLVCACPPPEAFQD
jgi:glycine dehydrogenase